MTAPTTRRPRWRVTRWDGDGTPPRTVATFGNRDAAKAARDARQAAEPHRWFYVTRTPRHA
jgi:hypothetical protein